ncbi:MAG: PKD domain-containing protein [bacterium]|nr:PKD domain-containing protein [bacterium]
MNKVSINSTSKKTQATILFSALLLTIIAAGCGDFRDRDVEVLDTGLVSVNGQEIILTENNDTDSSLWLLAGDRTGEATGSLIKRSSGTTLATVSGAVYVTSQGDGFTVSLDAEGYPAAITYTDGSVMTLSNYTDTTVDAQLTPAGGAAEPVQTIALNKSFAELKTLISENGLIVDTALSASAADRQGRTLSSSDYAADARRRRTVIKLTGTALSIAGCVGALYISPVAPPVAAIACTSAYAGLVSTVEYLTDTTVYEGNDTAGGVSFFLSAGACVGLSIADCASVLLSIADAAIADCQPSQDQFVKRCYKDHVYWFNDCGVRSEPADECTCGCQNGACIPIDDCSEELTISVSAAASPACAATGENIFFSASLSGGDTASYVYAWDFGDGGSSALDADAHSYSTAGRKTVTLTVSDSLGNYGFAAIPVQIEDCEQFLEAEIASAPDCSARLTAVSFSSRIRGGDGTYSYLWTFGDGATSTQAHPAHRYSRDGLYMATLTVTDRLNNHAQDAFLVQIGDCPTDISVTVSAYATCIEVGDSLIFSAEVSGTNPYTAQYAWDFSDGTTSIESQAIAHTFSVEGTYTVTVTVSDNTGNSAAGSFAVQVGNCAPATTTTTINSSDEEDLITKCNALDYITVSYDSPEYSEYSGGGCSLCKTEIRVNYVGPEDIEGVRMMYKQPTLQTYGPWLWRGLGPLPDIYEFTKTGVTSCCDGEGCTVTSDISLIGAVFYNSECDDILEDPENLPLPLLNIDQPCRGYSK